MAKPKTKNKPRLGIDNPFSPTSKKVAQKQTNRKGRREGKKANKDYDGDGEVESASDEYMGSKDKAIRKAQLKEAADITNFITAISSKKYAVANKYLKAIITDKIQARIKNSLNEPLFTL
jgi:hypothetical protein